MPSLPSARAWSLFTLSTPQKKTLKKKVSPSPSSLLIQTNVSLSHLPSPTPCMSQRGLFNKTHLLSLIFPTLFSIALRLSLSSVPLGLPLWASLSAFFVLVIHTLKTRSPPDSPILLDSATNSVHSYLTPRRRALHARLCTTRHRTDIHRHIDRCLRQTSSPKRRRANGKWLWRFQATMTIRCVGLINFQNAQTSPEAVSPKLPAPLTSKSTACGLRLRAPARGDECCS